MTIFKQIRYIAACALGAIAIVASIPAAAEVDSREFEQPAGTEMGIYVADILNGTVLADARADEAFVPASVMKAVTAASVVSLFDTYTRFATRVTVRGRMEHGHIWVGDLVIHATGDPTMESSRYPDYAGITDSIADGLRRLGIDSITGTVTIDYSSMPESGLPKGWLEGDRRYRYGAGHHPVNWHDNTFTLSMPSQLTMPRVPGLEVTTVKKRRGAIRSTYDLKLNRITLTGRMPKNGWSGTFGNPDPIASMVSDITVSLQRRGIGIGLHDLPIARDRESEALVYLHRSPTLDEILRSMMYWSDNLLAEAMLRIIAPTEPREVAAERELTLWKLKGADIDNISIIDGSGLSRQDRLTPIFLADVLEKMALGPKGMTYARLFPIAGRSGTVRRLFAGTPLEGKLALKSGTMTGVRCVAGYKLDAQGYPTHVIVVLTNSSKASSAQLNQAIVQALLKIFA